MTFVEAFICLHQFRGESHVETWLRTIVVNAYKSVSADMPEDEPELKMVDVC